MPIPGRVLIVERPGLTADDRRPVTLPRLLEMKQLGQPIVMVTAYDYPSAQVVEEALDGNACPAKNRLAA